MRATIEAPFPRLLGRSVNTDVQCRSFSLITQAENVAQNRHSVAECQSIYHYGKAAGRRGISAPFTTLRGWL